MVKQGLQAVVSEGCLFLPGVQSPRHGGLTSVSQQIQALHHLDNSTYPLHRQYSALQLDQTALVIMEI